MLNLTDFIFEISEHLETLVLAFISNQKCLQFCLIVDTLLISIIILLVSCFSKRTKFFYLSI